MSTSDADAVYRAADTMSAERLKTLAHALKQDYPDAVFVPVQLIGGKRWAALDRIPPAVAERFQIDLPHRMECAPGWGIVVYGWSNLDAAQQKAIAARCAG